jgi:hypothetical protein
LINVKTVVRDGVPSEVLSPKKRRDLIITGYNGKTAEASPVP